MENKESSKKKRNLMIPIVIAVVVIIVFCGSLFNRCPELCTIDYLKKWFDLKESPCTVSFDGGDRKESASLIAEMLSFDEWQKTKDPVSGEKEIIKIVMSEEYEITIFESYARVHYGYSRITEAEDAYYSVPHEVIEKIAGYKSGI